MRMDYKREIRTEGGILVFTVTKKHGATRRLTIVSTEAGFDGIGRKYERLSICEEDVYPFLDGVTDAIAAMVQPPGRPTREERIVKAKQSYSRAYEPWDKEEDEQLREEIRQQLPVSEIARRHQRNRGAIRSRIVRHYEELTAESAPSPSHRRNPILPPPTHA